MKGNAMKAAVTTDIEGNVKTLAERLSPIRKMILPCIQCGTCSGSCPNADAMDVMPRHLWRLLLTNNGEEIFKSRTFALCSTCYSCMLRCPRGLPLTDAMSMLKQVAAAENLYIYRKSVLFYQSFMESVRRHGRVREMEFMTLYFMSMKNPMIPMKFTPLGMRLMARGKVSIEFPSKGTGRLDALFSKAKAIEDQS
jgi:heterodisulfide reductase subunit C2